jgi:hypothetical protein
MRKSYLLIAAVATAFLASCSNERVLNKFEDDSQLVPITFTSYSEKATKGDPNDEKNTLEYYHNTFAVHGTKRDIYDGEIQYVFGNPNTLLGTTCTYTTDSIYNSFYGTNWKYDEDRYWDRRAIYNIIAYAPALQDTNLLHFTYGNTKEVGSLGIDGRDILMKDYHMRATNLQQPAPQPVPYEKFTYTKGQDRDVDIMVADTSIFNRSGKVQETIIFSFHHIFSKIDISVAKVLTMNAATVIVDSITISGLRDKGSYYESLYGKDDPKTVLRSGWILDTINYNPKYQISYIHADNHDELPDTDEDGALRKVCFVESLLLPQILTDDVILSIKYHFFKEGGDYTETCKYEGPLKDIFNGKIERSSHYSILLTLDSKAIGFDVKADNWTNEGEGKINLDEFWNQ